MITIPATVLLREIEGQSFLLNLESGYYYQLDEIGTQMWRALTQAGSLRTAIPLLLEEFEVNRERLRDDLGALLEDLQSEGLLETTDEQD